MIRKCCLFLFCLGSILGLWLYFQKTDTTPVGLYEVEQPQHRDLKQEVSASGTLEVKNRLNIGSQITGNIKALYVEENDRVEKGQLLAEIETPLGDAELLEAQTNCEVAWERLNFCKKAYESSKEEYRLKLISFSTLREIESKYLEAAGKYKIDLALQDKKQREHAQTKIFAPVAGVIIHVAKNLGEKIVADDKQNLLFQLAPNIHSMIAELTVDERDFGLIKKGQSVKAQFDAFSNLHFDGIVENISFSPKTDEKGKKFYYAKVGINNSTGSLRPGMRLNALIHIDSSPQALSITSRAFLIKQELIQLLSEMTHFAYKPFDKVQHQPHEMPNLMYVWKVDEQNKTFVEQPVTVGIHNNVYYQVTEGLNLNDKVIVDILEDDEMNKIYEKFFKKTL